MSLNTEDFYDYFPERFCDCGLRSPRHVSWRDSSIGRRFYSCANFQDGGCDFFDWYDDPINNLRTREVMIKIMDATRALVVENSTLRKQNKTLKKAGMKGVHEQMEVENACLRAKVEIL